MTLEFQPFDAADHIETSQDIRWFLEDALAEDVPAELVRALRTVLRSRIGRDLTASAGLSAAEIERALGDAEHPDLAMIAPILAAVGLRLGIVPIEAPKRNDAA